jgi:hypothetical protein
MRKRVVAQFVAFAALVGAVSRPAAAQSVGRPFEFGLDALASFGLGNASFTRIAIPAQRLRIGYEFSDRASFEPFGGFNYLHVNGGSATDLELGAGLLFYLTGGEPGRPARMATTVSRIYLRPYVLLDYADVSGGGNNTDFGFGAGLGLRQPLGSSRFATRWEVNVQHVGGNTDATSLGVAIGLSFFVR